MAGLRTRDIVGELFAACDGQIELRALPGPAGGRIERLFCELGDLASMQSFLSTYRTYNLYWGVATRRDDTGGSLANCLHYPALFADMDFKTSTEFDTRARLNSCPLVPTLVVVSGGGLQPYWFFREPEEITAEHEPRLRDVLRRLASYLGADMAAAECARVLRIPGTRNFKYEPPRRVVAEQFDAARRYNLTDFDWLPAVPVVATATPIDLSDTIGSNRNVTLYKLARGLKAKGLPHKVIASTIIHVNAECCAPPLDQWEVNQILHNALTQPDRPLPSMTRRTMEAVADVR